MTAAPDVLTLAAETGAVLRSCPGDRDRLAGWLLAELSAMVTAARAERDEAAALLERVLFLRMNGERAPGGDETWPPLDRDVERFLRSLLPPGTVD